jgi:hypothetical protein
VEDIIYYLGEIVRTELRLGGREPFPLLVDLHTPQPDGSFAIRSVTPFRLYAGGGEDPSIDVTHNGLVYSVKIDPAGNDRSGQVMEIVLQLLALHNSAKDLPAPSVIPVISR